ncbi:MAG: hypothetical protein IKI99_04335 [Firmicutes bacterium]|nr:hypothetical protein [Bacillota bacterium]
MMMLCGMVFTFFFGVVLHFVYGWSRNSLLVAFIAPVNESLFEHLKMLMTPYGIWALAEYAHYGQYMHAFVPGKVIGLWLGFVLMIGLHLLYESLLDRRVVWLDVGIFGVAVFAAFTAAEFCMTLVLFDSAGLEVLFDALLVLTVMVFAVFTVYPPHHWLFRVR